MLRGEDLAADDGFDKVVVFGYDDEIGIVANLDLTLVETHILGRGGGCHIVDVLTRNAHFNGAAHVLKEVAPAAGEVACGVADDVIPYEARGVARNKLAVGPPSLCPVPTFT